MKFLALLLVSIFSVSSFALTDAELNTIINKAAVKTDLYFCFKAALGASPSGDKMIDKLVNNNCDKNLEEAKALNISNEEIEAIAKRVFEETKQSDFDKALEEALNH
ncbi:MAG: hypothetical protein Q7U04_07305 [Bacteriovorax sp.]|nr:hypothetical protein [Bacteriovorax sp.]